MIKKLLASRPLLTALSFSFAALLAILAGPSVGLAAYLRMFMSYYSPIPPPPEYCKDCKDQLVGAPAGTVVADGQYYPHCSDCYSSDPICYSTGEVVLRTSDISSQGFGGWGVTRSFDSKTQSYPWSEPGMPTGWYMAQWPRITADGAGNYLVSPGARNTCSFNLSGGVYTPNNFHQEKLTANTGTAELSFVDTLGNQTVFYDSTQGALALRFKRLVDLAQNTTSVTYGTSGATLNRVLSINRSTTVNGTTTQEQWTYTYGLSGAQTGLLQGATLQRQVNSGGWVTVRQVAYTYYSPSLTLQRAVIEDGSGNSLGAKYYRYYTAGTNNFYGLKYSVNDTAYERLKAASGGTDAGVDAATDATVAVYANHFFTYDANNRVTEEIQQGDLSMGGCSCAPANNQGTFTYSYTTSTNANGYNSWAVATTETLPDGNQNIVYTNYLSQVMLKVFKDSTTGQQWMTYIQYDSKGREIYRAMPSAVVSYNSTQANLGVSISASAGLIQLQDYYTTTNLGSGQVAGYQQDEKVQQGSAGTPVLQKTLQYTSHTDASGNTVYPFLNVTKYRNTDGTGGQTTTFAYTWQGTTNQLQSTTTTYPAVTTAQNGPGTSDTEQLYFDAYARQTWFKDGDGFIRYQQYDQGTAATTEAIADVDTTRTGDFFGLPSGWTTPAGGGLHLKTLYTVDGLGRRTKTTDPKGQITYSVYNDVAWQVNTYAGWNAGTLKPTLPTYMYRQDRAGSYVEILTTIDTPTTSGGVPTGLESVTTANLQTLRRNYLDTADRKTYTDEYFSFSGLTYSTAVNIGTLGTNFYRTSYGYDSMGRQNRIQDPSGTINRTVFDSNSRQSSTWIGTNDTPTSGQWSPTNNAPPCNMLQTTSFVYDAGGVGDGDLTSATVMSESGNYSAQFQYDFRCRETARIGPDSIAQVSTLDNLGEVTLRQVYANTTTFSYNASNLRRQSDYSYDERDRAYLTNLYEVYPSTSTSPAPGTIGNKLPTNLWYNRRGQRIKTKNSNNLFEKTVFDGAGRKTRLYTCYNDSESSYLAAYSAANNTVIEETINYFDQAGNLVTAATFKRADNDTTSTGDLNSSMSFANVTVNWFDLANRITNRANFGRDNGPTTFYVYNASGALIDTNANGIPDEAEGSPAMPNSSPNYLAFSFGYDSSGFLFQKTDNLGRLQQSSFDRTGKVLSTIDHYVNGAPNGGSLDSDVTVQWTYLNGVQLHTITALNPKGGSTVESQTTTYSYASAIDLTWPTTIAYPDNSGGSDQQTATYDRLGRRLTATDPRGVVQTFAYDTVGRFLSTGITTLPTGVDGAVRRLQVGYDDMGRPQQLSSYSAASGGTVVNDYKATYNQLYAVAKSQQSHSGAVGGTSPAVQYSYADNGSGGVASYIREASVTYPGSYTGGPRTIFYNYPAAASLGDHLDRLDNIAADAAGTTKYTQYTYTGAQGIMKVAYPSVTGGLNLDLGSGGTYSGLDRFGRVTEQKWVNSGTTLLDDYQYAYDFNGNQTSRAPRPTSPPSGKDDYYQYDGVNRLASYDRGNLSGGTITDANSNLNQHWTALESLGNWRTYTFDNDGGGSGTAVTQTRTINSVDQVTAISNTSGGNWISPTYDAAGDMLSGPVVGSETTRQWFTYDAWHRMVKVQKDSSGHAGSTIVTYAYDAMGRRINRNVSGGTKFDYYYNENWQVLEVRYNNHTAPSEHYVWDKRGQDDVVVRFRATTTPGTFNETLYYTQDANGNTTALIDGTGTVQERYTYDPYGNPHIWASDWTTSRTSSSFANEIMYAGYRRDLETALYHVRYRMYHPTLGGWMHRDPIGYDGGTFNLTQYVTSKPTKFTDWLGLEGGEVVNCYEIGKSKGKDALDVVDISGPIGPGIFGEVKVGASGKICDCCWGEGKIERNAYFEGKVYSKSSLGIGFKVSFTVLGQGFEAGIEGPKIEGTQTLKLGGGCGKCPGLALDNSREINIGWSGDLRIPHVAGITASLDIAASAHWGIEILGGCHKGDIYLRTEYNVEGTVQIFWLWLKPPPATLDVKKGPGPKFEIEFPLFWN